MWKQGGEEGSRPFGRFEKRQTRWANADDGEGGMPRGGEAQQGKEEEREENKLLGRRESRIYGRRGREGG